MVHWENCFGILNINFIVLGVNFYGDFKNEFRLSKAYLVDQIGDQLRFISTPNSAFKREVVVQELKIFYEN